MTRNWIECNQSASGKCGCIFQEDRTNNIDFFSTFFLSTAVCSVISLTMRSRIISMNWTAFHKEKKLEQFFVVGQIRRVLILVRRRRSKEVVKTGIQRNRSEERIPTWWTVWTHLWLPFYSSQYVICRSVQNFVSRTHSQVEHTEHNIFFVFFFVNLKHIN